MALGMLMQQVLGAIGNHADQQQGTGFNANPLLSEVESLFGQHAANTGQSILPASQDPYGDPGAGGGVLPASMDPYGDPADRR